MDGFWAASVYDSKDSVEWRTTVPDPDLFRERARRCRELLKVAVAPEVIDQLKVWSREFDADAHKVDDQMTAARRACDLIARSIAH